MIVLIIAALACATVALFVLGLTIKSERAIIQERVRSHGGQDFRDIDSIQAEMELPFKERIIQPFLRRVAGTVDRWTPSGAAKSIEEKLDTAGRPWRLGALEFIGLRVLSVALFVLLSIFAASWLHTSHFIKIFLVMLIVVIGIYLPLYLLNASTVSRQYRIRKVLPDTLDLLMVSVEAGLGLDGAIQKVVEKTRTPLSDELSRVLNEVQIGKLRVDALRDLSKRANVNELSSFIATLCQADLLGVSISQVLRVQSETMRSMRSQRIRETSAKLPVKMLFPLIFCIFPAIFVVILAPSAIHIARAFSIIK